MWPLCDTTRCQAARSSLPQTNQSSSQADLKSMHSDIALPGLHGRHKACSPRRLHHEPSAPSEHWWRILLETALLPRRGQLRGCLIKSWPCLPRPVAANEDLPWLKGRSDQWLGRCLGRHISMSFSKKVSQYKKSQGSSKPCPAPASQCGGVSGDWQPLPFSLQHQTFLGADQARHLQTRRKVRSGNTLAHIDQPES